MAVTDESVCEQVVGISVTTRERIAQNDNKQWTLGRSL